MTALLLMMVEWERPIAGLQQTHTIALTPNKETSEVINRYLSVTHLIVKIREYFLAKRRGLRAPQQSTERNAKVISNITPY